MNVILNLWQEQIQEIVVSTKAGRKLRLHIDKSARGYCLSGEFFEVSDQNWYRVEFTTQKTQNAEEILKGCIENLNQAMQKKSDSISELHSTCNALIVSETIQNNILSSLGINAPIKVN